MTRCEGYRRYGGAFSFGPIRWTQCDKDAEFIIRVRQDGATKEFPICKDCWREAQEKNLDVKKVRLIA